MKAIDDDAMSSSRRPAATPSTAGTSAEARFRALAAGELDRAYRLAGLLMGDATEAEDATQEALLRAWTSLGSLRDPAGFQAWFDRILVNICRDRLRRRGRIRFRIGVDGQVAVGRRGHLRGGRGRGGTASAGTAVAAGRGR